MQLLHRDEVREPMEGWGGKKSGVKINERGKMVPGCTGEEGEEGSRCQWVVASRVPDGYPSGMREIAWTT